MLLLELEQEIKPLSRREKFELIRYLLDLVADDADAQQTAAPVSFLQAARMFAGCIADTPSDLSTNPEYFEGYGA